MRLRHIPTNNILLARVQWCDSYFSRLRGLMFRATLPPDEGIVIVEGRDSRIDTSIHMFFMNFAIGVFWLDTTFRVVDTCHALPWRPFYASRHPARYVLETHPSLLQQITIGDTLAFEKN